MLFPSLIYKKRKMRKYMKNYEKPTIIVSQDEPEGVYMGSGNKLSVSGLTAEQDWNTGGTAGCTLDLSNLPPNNLTLVFNFNMNIADAWIDGGTQKVARSTASINFYSAPASALLHVSVNPGDVNQLRIIDASYEN